MGDGLLGFPHSTRIYTHTETHACRSMASWQHKRVDRLMDGWMMERHVKLHNVGVRPIHVFSPSEIHTHGHAPRSRRALAPGAQFSGVASRRPWPARHCRARPRRSVGTRDGGPSGTGDGAGARAAAVRLPWQHGYSGEPHAHTAVPAGALALCRRRAGRWGLGWMWAG
jgi:hypothetical protein